MKKKFYDETFIMTSSYPQRGYIHLQVGKSGTGFRLKSLKNASMQHSFGEVKQRQKCTLKWLITDEFTATKLNNTNFTMRISRKQKISHTLDICPSCKKMEKVLFSN